MSPKSTQALEEAIAALSERFSELHASMEQHHDSLIVVVPNIQQHLAAVPAPVASFPSPSAEQYFAFYQIPPSQRLDVISFYMKGETLSWFKWMFTNCQLSSWEAFVRALELCFGHSSFDNHQAMLFKLHQRGSVAEFQAEFERLCNRVVGLPPDALSKYFISMLRLDIQCELREEGWKTASSHWMSGRSTEMKQFNKASGARLVESKLFSSRPLRSPPHPPTLLPTPPVAARCLSPTELQERRAKGLCFNCDEKFSPGHRFVANSPRTLCLRGLIHGYVILVLIDSDSSHNIIQPRVVAFLSLAESPLPSFPVLVGNGATLHCSGVCHDFPLVLQTHKFSVSLYVIPIFGADIVLGVQWLSSLGTFVSDFSVPSMQFSYGDTWATRTGSPSSTPLFASFSHDGIITPSTSQFLSPILLVCKKDGTWRFCVDYHTLNAVTVRDRLPIPTVDELLHELHGASVFSKLDLRAGYHKICVAPEDAYKSAFRTVDDHFKFLVMLFSFYNAPLIFSRLHLLQSNKFFREVEQCIFGVSIVDYLGHVIGRWRWVGDPAKLQAIVDWPPRSIYELRAFLGLTGYSRFVQHYTAIAGPLSDLLKGCQFHWSSAVTAAFNALKPMSNSPFLAYWISRSFDITRMYPSRDWRGLSQNRRPLAFFSKKLGSRMQTASAYNRECTLSPSLRASGGSIC
ncbi:UNVERIFIED_CONTAM: Transposon Ty3-G Gag-Pol polyprotein [Sesamum calycinum]|uniref:Transposon Ty3-G Gag-Pol polyprotein n=1 Tax=Sesamum calycinum TaxID=2727403 RepID=A0AAW2SVD5_9LAMI